MLSVQGTTKVLENTESCSQLSVYVRVCSELGVACCKEQDDGTLHRNGLIKYSVSWFCLGYNLHISYTVAARKQSARVYFSYI